MANAEAKRIAGLLRDADVQFDASTVPALIGFLTISAMLSAPDLGMRIQAFLSMSVAFALVLPIILRSSARANLARFWILFGSAGGLLLLAWVPDAKGPLSALAGVASRSQDAPSISANALAYLLVPAPAAAFGWALTPALPLRDRTLMVIAFLVGVFVIVATGSRGSGISLLLGASTAFVLRFGRIALRLIPVICLAILTVIAASPNLPDTLVPRFLLWEDLLHEPPPPVIGSYGHFAETQDSPRAIVISARGVKGGDRPLNLHNLVLQTWADFGVTGVAAVLIAITSSLVAATRLAHSPQTDARAVGFAAASALTAVIAVGLVESVLSTSFRSNGWLLTLVSPAPLIVQAFPLGFRSHQRGGGARRMPA